MRLGNKTKKNQNEKYRDFQRIFPHFWLESAVALCIIAVLGIAGGTFSTATLGQEMAIMSDGSSSIINVQPNDWNQQEVELELNAVEEEVTTQTIEYAPSQMCFIGDDRVVDLSYVITDAKFIATRSADLKWFNGAAIEKFKKIEDDVEIVIVALGINDTGNVDDYVDRLNNFAEQHKDKVCVYVNIGPVVDTLKTVSNSELEVFNQGMEQGLSDKWTVLDQYQYLKTEGVASRDGMHYSNKENAKILTWIIDSVKTQTIKIAN